MEVSCDGKEVQKQAVTLTAKAGSQFLIEV
jgi:hypothetical protein